jgi:hypothetical protein
MSSTSLESKILDLEARLRAENEMRDRDKMPKDLSHVMGSPAHGTGRRPRQCKSKSDRNDSIQFTALFHC